LGRQLYCLPNCVGRKLYNPKARCYEHDEQRNHGARDRAGRYARPYIFQLIVNEAPAPAVMVKGKR
jgi:hypothetical protein